MAYYGWGPTHAHADAGEGVAAPAADAFGTAELQQALPVKNNNNGDSGETSDLPDNWEGTAPTSYDYDAYTGRDGHAWESNAKVYEWDGQEGDIGPEFPELEMQLFGDPKHRAKEGIDFTS
jgi:ATP-dependent RNA helicase DDX3X